MGFGRELTIEWSEKNLFAQDRLKQLHAARDFALSGKEGKQVAFMLAQGAANAVGYEGSAALRRTLLFVKNCDGEEATTAFEQRRIKRLAE